MQKETTEKRKRIIEIPVAIIALFIVFICAVCFWTPKMRFMSPWSSDEISVANEETNASNSQTFTVNFYNQYSNDDGCTELLYTTTVEYGYTLLVGEEEEGVTYFEYGGATPTRAGHSFSTWLSLTGSYTITEDTDFVAIYSEDTMYIVNISYLSDNGNILQQNTTLVYEENDNVSIEIPEFDGYTSVITKESGATELTGTASVDGFNELKNSIVSNYGDYITIIQDAEYDLYTIELNFEYTAAGSKYVVNHYFQNLDQNGYTLYESEIISSDVYIGDTVLATENDYEGVTVNNSLSSFSTTVTLYTSKEDMASINIYYDRNTYYIYLDSAGGTYFDPIAVLYGEDITNVTDSYTPTKSGYDFVAWTIDTTYDTMPAEDLYYTATYSITTTSYTIFYWVEEADSDNFANEGSYQVSNVATESIVNILTTDFTDVMKAGFTNLVGSDYVDYYYYDETTTLEQLENGTSTLNNGIGDVEIDNSGATVINVYYKRNVYTLRFMIGRTNDSSYQVASTTAGSESASTWTTVTTQAYLTIDGTKYYDNEYTIKAKYGADISSQWPTVSDAISSVSTGSKTYYFISWGTSSSSSYYANNTNKNILGTYGIMSEDLIIDKTSTSTEHVLIGYWATSVRYFKYYYMIETLDQTVTTDYLYNGKYYTYDSNSVTTVRSTNYSYNLSGPAMANMTYVGSTYSSSGLGGSTESAAVNIYFYYNLDEYNLTFYNLNKSIILDFTDDEITTLQKYGIYVEDDEITVKYGADLSAIAKLRTDWTDYSNLVYPNELVGTKEYTFGGWYLDQEYLTEFDWTDTTYTTMTGNLIIYAYWIAPTYNVTFDVNEGIWEESSSEYTQSNGNYVITVDEGTVIEEPTEPTREGYTFDGWYYTTTLSGHEVELNYLFSESQYIYGDLVLTAKWSEIDDVEYTVNYILAEYDSNGDLITDISQYGSIIYVSSTKYATGTNNETITEEALIDITNTGSGFYLPDAVEKEITLDHSSENAIYFFYTLQEEIRYTIYYVEYTDTEYERGETPDSDVIISTAEYTVTSIDDTYIRETAASISGYTVTNYYKTSMQLLSDETLNTVYFYYTANTADVEYYINYYIAGDDGTYSGEPTATISAEGITGTILLSSNWEEYTTISESYFIGHELDTEYSDSYMILSDSNNMLNLYFKCSTYTITYDLQDGTFTEEVEGVEEQSDGSYLSYVTYPNTVIEPGTATKDGYSFAGWFVKNEDGTYTKFTFEEIVTEDTTLYAIWIETTEITITKVWDDDSNRDGIRPDTVEITVLQEGVEFTTVEVEVTEDNTNYTTATVEKYHFIYTDVDKTTIAIDATTLEFKTEANTYSVEEKDVPDGYTVTYNQDEYTVTNSHSPELVDKTVTKYWRDNSNADGFRTDTVKMQLYANGTAIREEATLSADSTENIDSNTWTYTWTGLYKYENGVEIEYAVVETEAPEEYSTKYVQSTLSVYNAYPPESELIVEVNWQDGDNRDGLRVESLQVLLQANDEDYDGLSEEEATVTLNEANGWAYEYGGLEKYNLAGDTYEYSAKLLENTEYATLINNGYSIVITIEENEDSLTKVITRHLVITATYTPETMERTITKLWVDNEDKYETRPEEIIVYLKSNDENTYYTATLTAADGWTYTFDEIYKYYNGGEELVYYIEEAEVSGYTLSSCEQDTNGDYTITNTLEIATVTVNKIWEGDSGDTSLRPSSVTVQLSATVNGNSSFSLDSYITTSAELTSEGGWSYTWAGLPKYDVSTGNEIEYSATEVQDSSLDSYYMSSIAEETDNTTGVKTISITNSKYAEITVTAVDKSNSTILLPGAVFMIEKLKDDGSIDDTFTAVYMTTSSDETDLGTLVFEDLEYGTYQITEVTAPEGYNLVTGVIAEITVDADNVETNVTVKHKAKTTLPATGGTGIMMVIVVGVIIAIIGTIICKRRKSQNEDINLK